MILPRRLILSLGLTMLATAPALAQQPGTPAATVVAVPPLTTPDNKDASLRIAAQASELIAQDLRTTSEVVPLPPRRRVPVPSRPGRPSPSRSTSAGPASRPLPWAPTGRCSSTGSGS